MLDAKQIQTFVDLLIGHTPIGVDQNGNESTVPTSPAIQSFVIARLGAMMPVNGWECVAVIGDDRFVSKRTAFASLLREVADGISPPVASTKPAVDLLGAVRDFLECTAGDMATGTAASAWEALAAVCSAAERQAKP